LKQEDRKYCVAISMFVTAVFVMYLVVVISSVEGSTSGLWFFILPVYALVCYFIWYGVVFSIETLNGSISANGRSSMSERSKKTFSILYLVAFFVLTTSFLYSLYLESKAKSLSISPAEMSDLYESSWASIDKYVLLAMASNVSATPEILDRLYHDPLANDLEKLTSLRALMNGDFRSLKVRIAEHQNTPVYLLEMLGNDEDRYIQKALVHNSNTPVEVRKKLWDRGDKFIRLMLEDEFSEQ